MKFRGKDYSFLSNMAPCRLPVPYNGKIYQFKCVEAAYHGFKDTSKLSDFENRNGYWAKIYGKKIHVDVEEWNARKDKVMWGLLNIKFKENPQMLERLKKIEGPIVEDNTWGDQYWGVCEGEGQNKLGKMLEAIRDKELNKS